MDMLRKKNDHCLRGQATALFLPAYNQSGPRRPIKKSTAWLDTLQEPRRGILPQATLQKPHLQKEEYVACPGNGSLL